MAKPWPVLLLVRELGIGGCERDITKIAIGLDRTRFTPYVASFQPEGMRAAELRAAGVPILHLPIRSFRNLTAIRGALVFRRYLRQYGIRLVHSYDIPTNLFAVPLARLFGVRHVVSSQLTYRELYAPAMVRLLPTIDRLSHRIHVNCEAIRRYMIESEEVPSERLYVCHNGVDTAVFHPDNRARLEPLHDASLVVGIVCALRAEKRVDLLLRAFAKVHNRRPGIKLAIVGGGLLLPDLETLARELGVAAACVFVPATPEVAPWLRAIDIFVLPSDSEAFSNALLEAMACGCCPVASRVGGNPELVLDGEHGFLFPRGGVDELAARLAQLIDDDALRERFAAAAARYARETFPLERALDRMQSLYTSLLSESSS